MNDSPPLEEQFYETDRARLHRLVPWLHLHRAFRLATRWQNLALAFAGVILLAAGRGVLSYAPFSQHSRLAERSTVNVDDLPRTVWPWERPFFDPALPTVRDASFGSAVTEPVAMARGAVTHGRTVFQPLIDFLRPASRLIERHLSWSELAEAWLHTLFVVTLGSVIGGAIARRVAVEFSGNGEPGVGEAIRFGIRDLPITFGAPLISLVGIGLLWAFGRGIAWLGRIPGIDESITAVLWGLLLLLSLVMALIVIGVAVAWPLMVCAHSTEGTDGYDALTRAYNYVFVRPWYSLWLAVLTMLYGSLLIFFVMALLGFVVHLTEWIAAGPISDEGLARITAEAPDLVRLRPGESAEAGISSTLGGAWYRGLATLPAAFVYSYFWTAMTLIYFLLRKSVDATDFDSVYLPRPEPKDETPLVGMAAVAQREAQGKSPPDRQEGSSSSQATDGIAEQTPGGEAS